VNDRQPNSGCDQAENDERVQPVLVYIEVQPIAKVWHVDPLVARLIHSPDDNVERQKKKALDRCFDDFLVASTAEFEERKKYEHGVAQVIPNLMFFFDKRTAANGDDEEEMAEHQQVQQVVVEQREAFETLKLCIQNSKDDSQNHRHHHHDEIRLKVV
jgi:hypothetical protein